MLLKGDTEGQDGAGQRAKHDLVASQRPAACVVIKHGERERRLQVTEW